MGTQKPGEWANSLIARFEEQVSVKNIYLIYFLRPTHIWSSVGK